VEKSQTFNEIVRFEISPLRQPSVDDDSGRDDIIYGVFDNLRLEFAFHTTGKFYFSIFPSYITQGTGMPVPYMVVYIAVYCLPFTTYCLPFTFLLVFLLSSVKFDSFALYMRITLSPQSKG